jgi:hypothetical protein
MSIQERQETGKEKEEDRGKGKGLNSLTRKDPRPNKAGWNRRNNTRRNQRYEEQ